MTTLEDRERMRKELHGLAELARDNGADSSGYVDLSAFASSDPNWVENALGRASQPSKIDRLDSESMHPVSLESLVDAHPSANVARSARMQRAFIVMSSACIAGLAALALVLALRPANHRPAVTQAAVAAAAPAPPAPLVAVAPAPATDAPAAAAAGAPTAPDTAAVQPQLASAESGAKATPATKHRYASPAPAPQARTTHARASSAGNGSSLTKSSKGSGSNDPLMAAIQQSMAKK